MGDCQHAVQVHGNGGEMAVDRHAEEIAAEDDAGIIHQDGDRPAFHVHPIAHGGNLLHRGHIQRVTARGELGGAQFGNNVVDAIQVAVRHHNFCPSLGELECDGPTQPVASAGDQRALLSKRHSISFRFLACGRIRSLKSVFGKFHFHDLRSGPAGW